MVDPAQEALREALFRAERREAVLERRVARLEAVNVALQGCLSEDIGSIDPAELFIRIVSSMGQMVAFDHALVLTPMGSDILRSEATSLTELAGRSFGAGPAAAKALKGRPVVTTVGRVLECLRGDAAAPPFGPNSPALVAPFVQAGRHGFALFVRTSEQDPFDRDELEIAGQIAVLAAQMLSLKTAARAAGARGRLLASMSHELRTPLNGVLGMADLLDHGGLSESQHRLVGVIRSSAADLVSIIDRILDYIQLETGTTPLAERSFGLMAVLRAGVARRMPAAVERGLTLVLDYAPTLPAQVIGDAHRLASAVDVLIDNAIKFTEVGHVTVSVSGVLQGDRLWTEIAVRDTGPGIPMADREAIFEPFNQGSHAPGLRPAGVGLGLAVARLVAAEMGGTLEIADPPGGGTVFRLAVPLLADPVAPMVPGPSALAGLTIAVVDPVAPRREVLVARLSAWGAEAMASAEAPTPQALAKAVGPDGLVLADAAGAMRLRALSLLSGDAAARRLIVLTLDPESMAQGPIETGVIAALAPRSDFVAALLAARTDRLQRRAAARDGAGLAPPVAG